MPTFRSLPPEIRALIFEDMRSTCTGSEGMKDAAALSLASKEFSHSGRAILYGDMSTYDRVTGNSLTWDKFVLKMKAVITYPHLGALIRTLQVNLLSAGPALDPKKHEYHTGVEQIAKILRLCTNLDRCKLEDARMNEILYLLGSLKGCRHLTSLSLRQHDILLPQADDLLETGGLEFNAHDCGSGTNWLFKILAELCFHTHLKTMNISYCAQYTFDEQEEELGKLASVLSHRKDLSLLSISTLIIMCDFSTNFFFQIFDAHSLVHLTIFWTDCATRFLSNQFFPSLTHLLLEEDDLDPPCELEEFSVLWPRFPAITVFQFHNHVSAENREVPFDANRTDLPGFTAFLRSLPHNLRKLRFIDQEYFYEANMREVDALWNSGRRPNLLKIFMYKDYERGRQERWTLTKDYEDISLLLQSEFKGTVSRVSS